MLAIIRYFRIKYVREQAVMKVIQHILIRVNMISVVDVI